MPQKSAIKKIHHLHNLKSNSIKSIMWRLKNSIKTYTTDKAIKNIRSLNTSILGHKVTLISIFVYSNLPFDLEHTISQWYALWVCYLLCDRTNY